MPWRVLIFPRRKRSASQFTVALSGLTGVGKTGIALDFLNKHIEKVPRGFLDQHLEWRKNALGLPRYCPSDWPGDGPICIEAILGFAWQMQLAGFRKHVRSALRASVVAY